MRPGTSRTTRRFTAAVLAVVMLGCGGGATEPSMTPPPPPPTSSIPPGPYMPEQSYTGRNGYIEYIAGNAPVIYTAPHGGDLTPEEIPDRSAGRCGGSATTATDLNTRDLVLAMQQRHFARYGTYPHVVINHLARRKLDANRTETEATCGSSAALVAFTEWHAFIDVAKAAVLQASGRGWYMDMHGHAHAKRRLELGYLLTRAAIRVAPTRRCSAASPAGTSVVFRSRRTSRASAIRPRIANGSRT